MIETLQTPSAPPEASKTLWQNIRLHFSAKTSSVPQAETIIYTPFVDEHGVRPDTPLEDIEPMVRIAELRKDDEISSYRSHPHIQWAMVAELYLQKAETAEAAKEEKAVVGLMQKAEQAKEYSGHMRYLWWPEDKLSGASSANTQPPKALARYETLPIITTDDSGNERFMYSDELLDPMSVVGVTPSVPYEDVPMTKSGNKLGFEAAIHEIRTTETETTVITPRSITIRPNLHLVSANNRRRDGRTTTNIARNPKINART